MKLKQRAKVGLVTLVISLVFFGISTIDDTSIPITIFGSQGQLRILFLIGAIFLLPSYFLLTKRSANQVGERRYRRTFDIFE